MKGRDQKRMGATLTRIARPAPRARCAAAFVALLFWWGAGGLSSSTPAAIGADGRAQGDLSGAGGRTEPKDCVVDCDTFCTTCQGGSVTACTQCRDYCEEQLKCRGPYLDTTPICHYLDRGLNDQVQFTADRYHVFPAGVKTLADVDKLEFGLDIPGTYCKDSPHGVPCADESYSLDWWIDAVRLSVLGIPLFEAEKGPDDQALLKVRGGARDEGIVGFDGEELRTNPRWGFSFNELRTLFKDVVIDEHRNVAFDPDALVFPAQDISFLLDTMVGRALASKAKGCPNDLYCSNGYGKEGKLAFWADTVGAKQVDCDFGNCPKVGARRPSPWLEIRGSADRKMLLVDADLEIVKGSWDPGDCDGVGGGLGKDHCGVKYGSKGDFSLEVDLEFSCQQVSEGKFAVVVSATDVRVDVEGGGLESLAGLIDFGCSLLGPLALVAGCSGEDTVGSRILKDLDTSLFESQVSQELDSCPPADSLVDVGPDGTVRINLDGTIDCESEGACLGHGVVAGGGSFNAAGTPKQVAPAGLVTALGRGVALSEPSAALIGTLETYHGLPLDQISWDLTHAPAEMFGPLDPDEKIPMSVLDKAIPLVCAMADHCDQDLEFANIEVAPPILDDYDVILECNSNADPESDACQALAAVKAFVQQPEIWAKCVLPRYPAGEDPAEQNVAVLLWLNDVKASLETCKETAQPIESYIRLPFIALDITTGRKEGSDGFAFVDFQDAENVAPGTREDYACRHRPDQALIPDPYEYPGCADPDDESSFGDAGCPCRDIDIFSSEDVLSDGGFPDGAGSYLAHGLSGTGQFCSDGTGTTDAGVVVCGTVRQQGKDYPVCQECGVDTMVGCPCTYDSDCGGFEDGLICWGSELDGGWAPSGGGTCLPDASSADGREALSEMPWFCLDNCDAIDNMQDGQTACVFNQLAPFDFPHGTCVDFMGSCEVDGVTMPGVCEETGRRCDVNDACVPECEQSSDCAAIGFPAWYECDFAGGYSPGHCVPPGCAGPGAILDVEYCYLFR